MDNYISSQIYAAKTNAFWDTNRLQHLKMDSDDPQNLQSAAKEFASLMFHMLIKSMRDAQESFRSELVDSEEYKHYESMMDQQWAVELAHSSNNGIVDIIVQQLAKNRPNSEQETTVNHQAQANSILAKGIDNELSKVALQQPIIEQINMQSSSNIRFRPAIVPPAKATEQTEPLASNTASKFAGRDDFINKLLPYAVKAAQAIGTDPKLLLAQAALETGWGTKVAKLPDGTSSNNLFGIKANGDWQGKRVATKTTEYSAGVLQRKTDWFKAYDSFADSIQDYVQLIGGTTRYQKHMTSVHTPESYANALQEAGFATDPKYGEKIMQIYKGL